MKPIGLRTTRRALTSMRGGVSRTRLIDLILCAVNARWFAGNRAMSSRAYGVDWGCAETRRGPNNDHPSLMGLNVAMWVWCF